MEQSNPIEVHDENGDLVEYIYYNSKNTIREIESLGDKKDFSNPKFHDVYIMNAIKFLPSRYYNCADYDTMISEDSLRVTRKHNAYGRIYICCDLEMITYDGYFTPFGEYADYGSIETTWFYYSMDLFKYLRCPMVFDYEYRSFSCINESVPRVRYYSSGYSFHITSKGVEVIEMGVDDEVNPDPRIPIVITQIAVYSMNKSGCKDKCLLNSLTFSEYTSPISEIKLIVNKDPIKGCPYVRDWRSSSEVAEEYDYYPSFLIDDDLKVEVKDNGKIFEILIKRQDGTAWPMKN